MSSGILELFLPPLIKIFASTQMHTNYLLFFDFTFDADFAVFLPNAYIAEQKGNVWYFFKKANKEILQSLPQIELNVEQKELLEQVNTLQKPILIKKFAKKSSSIEVLYKNTQQKQAILTYIEEKTAQMLQMISENDFFLTINLNTKDEITKQKIQITQKILQPLLEFEKTTIGITYRLSLLEDNKSLIPNEHQIKLLNNEKSWLVIDKKLVKVAHIKALNVKPFLSKAEVFIPEKLISEYFDKFLKEILKKVEIKAKGFEIIHKNHMIATKLHLMHDFFANHYKIYLEFDYDGYTFSSNQSKKSHSVLEMKADEGLQITNYKRNFQAEAEKKQIVIGLGFSENEGTFFLKEDNPFASYFHMLEKEKELLEASFSLENIEIDGKKAPKILPQLILSETKAENDWFDLNMQVKQGDFTFHFKDLIKNIKENNPIYTLSDGSLFIIPQEWFSRYGTLVKFTKISEGKLQLPKNNYALLEELPELKAQTLVSNVEYLPSPNLKATLRPYQQEGVKWLLEHHYNGLGACLADDMGLGKTLQTIALLVDIHDKLPEVEAISAPDLFSSGQKQKEPLRVLVILPSSLVFNWYDETKRFAPHFKCTQYVGSDRKAKANRLQNYDMIFTSYPIVTRDAKIFQKQEFRYIILDESQRIKNKNSQTFKAIHEIKAQHKISLSGTPIENSLSDLWSQMQFINPNILGSFSHFSKYFKYNIEKKGDAVVLEELKTIISPFLLRRTKEQVLDDLPEMMEQIIYCQLSEAQEKWYEREKSKARNELLQVDGQISQFSALNVLMKLRQISNHPKLIDKQSEIPSGKYEEVINYMELVMHSNQKALVFSSFVTHLEIFQQWCQQEGIRYVTLTGNVPTAQRKAEVEAFQNDKSVKFFFISLKAGEVGLNLTQASHVLLLDPWWNPFSEKQAIARAHRLGQKNKVNVVRFVSKNTIEEKIIRLQQTKKELSQNIVEETAFVSEVIEHIEDILG
ncbi:SNF2 family N-terminal domain protein [Capnocytophaga cynodegmi]|uniref:SNF2 family N-terminal domain protein n=2 Tax=Capnocytophaga cynodegmi TaxID=28189 RepID=A0A0B7HJG9_9FLAO|nr:SNF2 family N-terminal domain protein [Capnocytophaga cynodegmi]